MKPPVTVVAAMDASPNATASLPIAKTLAKVLNATLHVLHVTNRTTPPPELIKSLGLSTDDLRGSVLDVAHGDPARAILEEATAWNAAAIVLCANPSTHQPERPLGHIAEQVVLEASIPVVLVSPFRPPAPWSLEHILLPHDGTPGTAHAIGPALLLAARSEAHLTALHVAVPDSPREVGSYRVPQYLDQPQHEWPSWANEFRERLCCGMPLDPRKIQLLLACGNPGLEIVRVADEKATDLIVLGWHGCMAENHASTLKTVLVRATCPVMVIRTEELAARDAPSVFTAATRKSKLLRESGESR